MKRYPQHSSVEQIYINISDTLAVFRSFIGLIYFMIAVVLVFSCIMYVFFEIIPVKGSNDVGSGDTINCLVQVRGGTPEKDDLVVLRNERLSAKIIENVGFASDEKYKDYQLSDEYLLVSINEVNGSKTIAAVKPEEIEGIICFVVSTIKSFGKPPDNLF